MTFHMIVKWFPLNASRNEGLVHKAQVKFTALCPPTHTVRNFAIDLIHPGNETPHLDCWED